MAHNRSELPRFRLFCFPYAGGNAQVFRAWPKDLPSSVEIHAIQLPGRGTRFGEPLLKRMTPLLAAIDDAITPLLDVPYAFFGHSMGALIAYELTRQLRARGKALPKHLFLSGRKAPEETETDPPIHALSTPAFLSELRRYGGVPEAVLQEPDLLNLLLPIVRADFEVIETWQHARDEPLDTPITTFGGVDDHRSSRALLEGWRPLTRGDFAMHILPGGHFFIQSAQPALVGFVRRAIESMTGPLT